MKTVDFFNTHSVFSLDEAVAVLDPPGGRTGTLERMRYHLSTGRIKLVTRGVYAVVPPGMSATVFQPDPFLVAAAVRPDGVFAYHSALDLLGVGHSLWQRYVLFTDRRRRSLQINTAELCFLGHPSCMQVKSCEKLGLRQVEYHGRILRVTGPERTLVEGFRRLAEVGGMEEMVTSAAGFSVLDINLLEKILHCYHTANLWAATGWFLERFQSTFRVPESYLERLALHRPRSPQYLDRNRRNGMLSARWNLMLPKMALESGEPDER